MKSSTLFLWEKSLYLPGPNGWERLVVARPEDTALLLSQRLKPGSSVRMIYESAALHTEVVDVPEKADRSIVNLSLAETHPSLGNTTTPWSFQKPWPSGNAYSSFLTSEEPSYLYDLREKLQLTRHQLISAQPLISLADAIGATRNVNTVFVVIEGTDQAFVVFYLASGLRASIKLSRKSPDFDLWQELRQSCAEYGINFETSHGSTLFRIYQMPGTDFAATCPFWDALKSIYKVELNDLDALVALHDGLPKKHTGSLTGGFPQVVVLTTAVQVLSLIALLAIGIYGWLFYQEQTAHAQTRARTLADTNATAFRKKHLLNNKERIESQQHLVAQETLLISKATSGYVPNLGGIVPIDYTVTEFHTDRQGAFTLSAVVWKATKDSAGATMIEGLASALERGIPGLRVTADKSFFDANRKEVRLEGSLTGAFPASATPAANAPAKKP